MLSHGQAPTPLVGKDRRARDIVHEEYLIRDDDDSDHDGRHSDENASAGGGAPARARITRRSQPDLKDYAPEVAALLREHRGPILRAQYEAIRTILCAPTQPVEAPALVEDLMAELNQITAYPKAAARTNAAAAAAAASACASSGSSGPGDTLSPGELLSQPVEGPTVQRNLMLKSLRRHLQGRRGVEAAQDSLLSPKVGGGSGAFPASPARPRRACATDHDADHNLLPTAPATPAAVKPDGLDRLLLEVTATSRASAVRDEKAALKPKRRLIRPPSSSAAGGSGGNTPGLGLNPAGGGSRA